MNQNQFRSLMLFLPALVIVPLNTSYALSPQQYCESLEKKSPDSFEILNLEGGRMEGAVPVTSTFEKPFTLYGVSSKISFEACGGRYELSVGSTTSILGMVNSIYPICGAGNSVPSTAMYLNGGANDLPNAGDLCSNVAGYSAKNGNSCHLDKIEISYVGGGGTVKFTKTELGAVGSLSVKYCLKGKFMFAAMRSGPLSRPYDSVQSCVSSDGRSTPGVFTNKKPLQGEIFENVKKWLLDEKGCI
ncbi:MAG: hypothetical protein JNL11_16610 [Bdellovibrionaceae bacterium]|nr:hypothetical protein [Pseudobdellovibrionaceae bacterium]